MDVQDRGPTELTMTEWIRVEGVSPGVQGATLTNVQLTLGASSGKPMFVWTFKLDSGHEVNLYTSKRGKGATKGYECAKALGLSQSFSHAEAVGRTCRLDIDVKGTWPDIKRVLPKL